MRPRIAAWFERPAGGEPPWYAPGWLDDAVGWIDAWLAEQDATRTGPVEQMRSWAISALLRVPSSGGDLYFKAMIGTLNREVTVTQALAANCPGSIPAVAAADGARGWLLLRDFHAQPLAANPDLARWEAALREYAEIQIALAERIDELFGWGCSDSRLERLAAQIDPLLGDTDSMLPDQPGGIPREQINALQAAGPRLGAMCERLAAFGLPDTLVHGDFHDENIAVDGARSVYFDWTDACVAHPFFDVAVFLSETSMPDNAGQHARLLAAYLEPWGRMADASRLQEAAGLARVLGALRQCVTYQQLVRGLGPRMRWEFERALPFWLDVLHERLVSSEQA